MELKGPMNQLQSLLKPFLSLLPFNHGYSHMVLTLEAQWCVMRNRTCMCFLCGTMQVLFNGYVCTCGLFLDDGILSYLGMEDLKHLHCSYLWVMLYLRICHFPPLFGKLPTSFKKENQLLLIPDKNRELSLMPLYDKPEFGTFVTLAGFYSCFYVTQHYIES